MKTTIAAISTGQAPGGIGVVRVSGPEAFAVCEQTFHSYTEKHLPDMPGYTCTYGYVHLRNGEKLDDCVATVFRGPKSYTGEDVVEFSCHGGLYLTRRVLQAVLDAGANLAGPGEFTKRAFLNGKMDLAQAEAVMELIHANGQESARQAEAGSSGALSRRIDAIADRLSDLASHLAAWADFPDEDVEAVSPDSLRTGLEEIRASLRELLAGFERGKIYREGLRTVIAGRPNVGKSTLMNLLAGCKRSIVTEYPGTTRDIVEETVNLGGIPLLLADTAGLRDTEDPVEKIGVEAARERIRGAQLVLAVFDSSRELEEEDFALMDTLRETRTLAIVNKGDLEARIDFECIASHFTHWVVVSAGEEEGIERVEEALRELLGVAGFDAGDGQLFTQRQRVSVGRALEYVDEAVEAFSGGMTLDAVTVCVEGALGELYELTGRKVSEEVVDKVFETFCVGK